MPAWMVSSRCCGWTVAELKLGSRATRLQRIRHRGSSSPTRSTRESDVRAASRPAAASTKALARSNQNEVEVGYCRATRRAIHVPGPKMDFRSLCSSSVPHTWHTSRVCMGQHPDRRTKRWPTNKAGPTVPGAAATPDGSTERGNSIGAKYDSSDDVHRSMLSWPLSLSVPRRPPSLAWDSNSSAWRGVRHWSMISRNHSTQG